MSAWAASVLALKPVGSGASRDTGPLGHLGGLSVSVAGLTLVQRLVSPGLRQEHNDVAGFIYAVLGVAYAVLLAFVVIAVWEQYEAARDTADREASELAEIYWLAYQLPEPEGRQLQGLARSYARVVVEEAWPLMEDGQFTPQAWALVDEIRQRIGQFE